MKEHSPDERVQVNAAGQVKLRLKTARRDRSTHLVMSPLEFMQRLAGPTTTASACPYPVRKTSPAKGRFADTASG